MEKEILQSLLQHEEIQYVQQGIELIETMHLSPQEIQPFLPWKPMASFSEWHNLFSSFPQRSFLAIWLLGFLCRHNEKWTESIVEIKTGYKQLPAVPENIGDISHLTHITIHLSGITRLPRSLGSLSTLTHLSLYGNALTIIPSWVTQLPALEHLVLRDNDIQTLPDNLQQFQTLRHLDLSENNIQVVPSSLFSLPHIEFLSLANNPVSSLPHPCQPSPSLQQLVLYRCRLHALPPTLRSVTTIDARHNQLTWIPSELFACSDLSYQRNPLERVPDTLTHIALDRSTSTRLLHQLPSLSNLQSVDIKNLFIPLPEELSPLFQRLFIDSQGEIQWTFTVHFSTSQNKDVRYLQFKALCDLATQDPCRLQGLRKICFLNSQLNRIPSNIQALKNISTITEIDLRYCRVQTIPSSICHLTQLQALRLQGNPLSNETKDFLEQSFSSHIVSFD